jgi:hypothetical protein
LKPWNQWKLERKGEEKIFCFLASVHGRRSAYWEGTQEIISRGGAFNSERRSPAVSIILRPDAIVPFLCHWHAWCTYLVPLISVLVSAACCAQHPGIGHVIDGSTDYFLPKEIEGKPRHI